MKWLLLIVVIGVVAVAAQQEPTLCDISLNHGPQGMLIYNTDCTDDNYPYCTGSGLCAECSPGKSCSTCDCPANFECVQAQFNPVRNAAFCAPFDADMYDSVCSTDADCAIYMNNVNTGEPDIAMQGVCVSGLCKFCNRLAEVSHICEQKKATGDQDACYRGSKIGGRGCLAADVWNSNTWPLSSPLPTDPFEYEANQWSELRPCESRQPTASPSVGSNTSAATGITLTSYLLILTCTMQILYMVHLASY